MITTPNATAGEYTITFNPGSPSERKETFEFRVTDWNPNPEIPSLVQIELYDFYSHRLYTRTDDHEVRWF